MTRHTDAERADCPVCGGKPFVRRSHDADGMRWSHVECESCGLRTRGKWVASSSDECPIFFQEVWEEWPCRAPSVPDQSIIEAVDGWFARNTGLGGCSDKDVAELAAIFCAAPQPPEAAPARKPLTPDEIDRLADETDILYVSSGCGDYGSNQEAIEPFARAIERAHGIGDPS